MLLIPTKRKIVVLKLFQTKIMSNLEKTYKEHNLRSELYKVLYQSYSEKTNQVWKLFLVCCRFLLFHHLECLDQYGCRPARPGSRQTSHLKSQSGFISILKISDVPVCHCTLGVLWCFYLSK